MPNWDGIIHETKIRIQDAAQDEWTASDGYTDFLLNFIETGEWSIVGPESYSAMRSLASISLHGRILDPDNPNNSLHEYQQRAVLWFYRTAIEMSVEELSWFDLNKFDMYIHSSIGSVYCGWEWPVSHVRLIYDGRFLTSANCRDDTRIVVLPAFWRALSASSMSASPALPRISDVADFSSILNTTDIRVLLKPSQRRYIDSAFIHPSNLALLSDELNVSPWSALIRKMGIIYGALFRRALWEAPHFGYYEPQLGNGVSTIIVGSNRGAEVVLIHFKQNSMWFNSLDELLSALKACAEDIGQGKQICYISGLTPYSQTVLFETELSSIEPGLIPPQA